MQWHDSQQHSSSRGGIRARAAAGVANSSPGIEATAPGIEASQKARSSNQKGLSHEVAVCCTSCPVPA